jgi:hypothetical protein
MTSASQDSDGLPRPGPIGRGLRVILGLVVLYFFAGIVSALPELADGVNAANPLIWVGMAYAIYALPEIVSMVFSRRWPAWNVRGAAIGALAALADLALTGSPNGGAFGITFGLAMALVLGVLGTSFLVAAAVAAPG